jgi:hypothetical protein
LKQSLPILYIATDCENTNWLNYILAEFSRFNLAEFQINICSLDHNPGNAPVIYYTVVDLNGLCMPDKSHIEPNGSIEWISERLFILQKSSTTESRFACSYDIFWNAFVFLSRLEEYQMVRQGKHATNSYRATHPRLDKLTFDIPIVNNLFDEFETIIAHNFPRLTFGSKKKPVLELSHDVDYIEKTIQLRLKQTLFNGFNTFKTIPRLKSCTRLAMRTLKFLTSDPSYWCFDYWQDLEKHHDKRSIFYVFAQTGRASFKPWLIDPSYNIVTHKPLQNKLKQLLKENFEIGLHGSYLSAVDESMLVEEKQILEDILEQKVVKVRQHWLRYAEPITPVLHSKHFEFDSSLGWNDHMGFRSGCACQYRPYNHSLQKSYDYFVTPLVIMDSQIFDYGAGQSDMLAEKAIRILSSLGNLKSAHVSVSWHQRVASSDYAWHRIYEDILEGTREYL